MSLGFASGTLGCFLFQTEILLRTTERRDMGELRDLREGEWPAAAGRQPAAWPRLAMAMPGPGLGRLQPAAAAGARAPALPCRWPALEAERGREGEPGGGDGCVDCKEEQGGSVWRPHCEQGGRGTRQQHSAMVERALVHGGRVGISSSTWRAAKWPAWEAILGLFRAELDFGPKTKFAHLGLLSNFD
jgi:hypothetical protein